MTDTEGQRLASSSEAENNIKTSESGEADFSPSPFCVIEGGDDSVPVASSSPSLESAEKSKQSKTSYRRIARNIIFVVTLFSIPLFFGVTSLLGITYEGDESSSLYRYYCIFIFVMSMSFILFDKRNNSFKHPSYIIYLVLFVYVFIGLISGYMKDSLWLTLVAFSLPAACIGKYYANDHSKALFKMAKYLDILLVILSVCVLSLSSRLSIAIALGESSYSQQLSYYAALCFLLDIFLLNYGNSFDRLKFFKCRLARAIYYGLLPLFVVVIFFSGGRGGFVVVAAGTIAIAFLYRKVRFLKIILGTITIIAVTTILSLLAENVSSDFASQFKKNRQRVIAYIDTDDLKIDMTQTSGRDDVYKESWNMFLDNPTGYGLFNYKSVLMDRYEMPYPHNLFLEWLLQGGIIFFIIWFYAFCIMLIRLHRLIKQDIRHVILLPFLVYALVQLMFTGTYMGSTFFWFALSFSFNKRVESNRVILLETQNIPA